MPGSRVIRAALLVLACTSVLACSSVEDVPGIPLAEPDPITVRIIEPVDGALIGSGTVRIAGEVTGTSLTHVLINGESVPAEHGLFGHWLPVTADLTTIQVVHPDSGASDSISLSVDDLPPALEIVGPPRGTSVSGGSAIQLIFSAEDENGLASVVASGVALDTAAGSWTVDVPLKDGLNILSVEATDTAGNLATEHISVLSGTFAAETDNIDDAVLVHLGPVALRSFNSLVSQLADTLDYSALAQAQNPLIDSGLATVSILSAGIDPGTIVNVSATPDHLVIGLTVKGLTASTQLQLHTGSDPSYTVDLLIDETRIEVPLTIAAANGEYLLKLEEPTFEFDAPAVTVTGPDGAVPATAGIQGPVLDSLEKLLVDSALSLGVEAVQGMLGQLTQPFSWNFAGTDVTLTLSAVDVDVGTHGLELVLNGRIIVQDGTEVADDPGVLRTEDPTPYHPRGDAVTLAINDDLLHTIGHAVWRTGQLSLTVNQQLLDDLKAPVHFVAGFLAGVTDLVGGSVSPEDPLTLKLSTLFPPVLTDVPDSDAVGIALGDASLAFSTDTSELVTSIVAMRFAAGAVSGADVILLELAPFGIGFDLTSSDPLVKRKVEASVEPFVVALLEEISPLFSQLIGAIPIPDFGPVRPVGLTAGDAGTEGRWLVLKGLLVESAAGFQPL
ncbi:MAG: hypothetical protein ACI9WU_003301 [Myxococcota bacterium]|jgi:hypothetical protein